MRTRTIAGPVLAAAVVAGATLLLVAGCPRPAPSPSPSGTSATKIAGVHLVVGLDASVSARSHLGGYAVLAAQLAGRLTPGQDRLTLFRVDDQTAEFLDKPATGSADATLATIVQELQTVSPRRGTLPEKFWREAADRAQGASSPVVLVLFSDADNDDQRAGSAEAIRQAGHQLAKNSHIRAVVVCGAERRNWAGLRRCFAPLGERFHLIGPSEMEIERLARYLDATRQETRL